jgi:hypothetical protein
MTSSSNPLPVLRADSENPDGSTAARVVQSVKSAVLAQESEIKRWHRTFDANAKVIVNGERCALTCLALRKPDEVVVAGFWIATNSLTQSPPRVI